MRLKSINEAIKSYSEKNVLITDKEIRFEDLASSEQKILSDAFGNAWNGYDLSIDLDVVKKAVQGQPG